MSADLAANFTKTRTRPLHEKINWLLVLGGAKCTTEIRELIKMASVSFNKLQKRIRREASKACLDYNMIEDGDFIMVCVSGGADSYTMLDTLLHIQKIAPVDFKLIAVNLDQKQPGFPEDVLPSYLESVGVDYKIVEKDTYSVVKEKVPEGKTTCWLCSRLRRGVLYQTAIDIGATKVALGHHREDILETMLMNMFHGGTLKAMPPKLLSDDRQNIVIRPLAYCVEKDIKKYAEIMQFPIIPCNLCGSQPNLQRQEMKKLLLEWEKDHPARVGNMFRALSNVAPSQLLDKSLFGFDSLETERTNEVECVSYLERIPQARTGT